MSVMPIRLAGSDLDVANGARASLNVAHATLTPADEGLIRRLVADGHTEPIRGVWAKFRVECSVKIARQMMTHKRYLAISERSTRYDDFEDEFVMPPLRGQIGKKMDYRFVTLLPDVYERNERRMRAAYRFAYRQYERMLADGVSLEDAAYALPMGLRTALVMSGDLVGWLRFLARRAHPHAQHEGRLIAQDIETCLRSVAPITLDAWDQNGRRAL